MHSPYWSPELHKLWLRLFLDNLGESETKQVFGGIDELILMFLGVMTLQRHFQQVFFIEMYTDTFVDEMLVN